MGKPKKGTKAHDEDLDDDVTSGQMGRKGVEKPGDNTNMGKKDKKKNKSKADDDDGPDDDDVSITGKSDHKASDNTSKKDKKKKKGKTKADDDDDTEDDGKGDHIVAAKTNENTAASKKDKKKKKGKARDDDDDSEDDGFTGKSEHRAAEKANDSTAVSKKDKKKKKGKAKDDDDDDDERDIERTLTTLSLRGEDEMGVDDVPASVAKKKKEKKKTKGLSAFQLLGEMDDDDVGGGSDADQTDDDKSTKEDIVLEKVASESSKPKKKEKTKKKEKQKKPEEEDIDAIMASLDLEEASTEKKKGKKNKKTEEDKAVEEELTVSEAKEVEKVEPKVVTIDDLDAEDGEYEKKRKKKGKKGGQAAEEVAAKEEAGGEKKEVEDEEGDDDGGTVKSAAQKRKEKREREKQKKQQEKQKQKKPGKEEGDVGGKKDEVAEEVQRAEGGLEAGKLDGAVVKETTPDGQAQDGDDVEDEGKDGKKKKKKKGEKVEKEEKAAKPNKKLALLKEHLKKIQEEEQRAREEQERERLLEDERIRKYEEQKRLEEEKKLKKKLKKKEREERLKKEGKFLTEKQKQDKRRLEQMLEAMKEAGAELPSKEDVRKKKPIYTKKKKASAQGMGDVTEKSPSPTTPTSPMETETPLLEVKSATAVEERKDSLVEVEVAEEKQEAVDVAEEVKDEWDAESEDEEEEEEDEDEEEDEEEEVSEVKPPPKAVHTPAKPAAPAKTDKAKPDEEETSDEEDEEDEEDEDEDESSEESESEEELTPAERGKEKVLKRVEAANKERTTDNLRAPVVCVLGHVDTGKTKILDKLRKTNVQDGEAGGITQQIGATNVPKDAILDKTKMCKEFTKQELKLPGLLIIDTPGHESFSNLRVRGTSLCDIAILVIDIMHGLEPQTIESINLLKERKTPFVVALNKVDRLYQWKPQPMADVQNTVKKQAPHTKAEFDERAQQVILQLATEGLNAALFYENKNQREYVSMVPTSAHTGDGMGNLVALICELCQSMLAKRLMYSTSLQAVVMEVKAITGIGTTIDVILINGALNEGDTVVLAGTEGPIVIQIRGLLMPQPMKELRVKNQYEHHKTVKAAQGVKVIAKDMEKALAGLPLYVAHDADEKEYYKEEVAAVLKDTLESIKVQDRGVFVQASTLGSLEALLEYLKTSEVPYAGIGIGPVHKKDIMRASVMLEHDSQYAVILAFDVKVERDAQEMADNLGVRIFTADIIYHLFDAFMKFRDDLKRKRQEEFKHIAVFPCKLRILPQFIFNSRDPIVLGVNVEAGFLKEGTPICVPSKEFVDLGRVAGIEMNHKPVEIARQGQEICIKIMPLPGEAPKMFGRHFDDTDMLVSKISRQSIDAVKDHFREEMSKPDWKLMVELKKQFEIL